MMHYRDIIPTFYRLLWEPDLAVLPRWHALPLRFLRIIYAVIRDLTAGQLTLRAMSLVYTTLLSLVPLLAVSFSVMKGLGVHYQIEPLLLKLLQPLGDQGAEITGRIIAFVENIRAGVLGTVGLGILIYTVISLIQKIEAAFNASWRVAATRSLGQRLSNYLSVVMVGPMLLVAALGLTATVTHSRGAEEVAALFGPLVDYAGRLLPYLMVIAAFTFVYLLVPNTRVRLRSALAGGVVAGILWETVGWAFTSFVVGSSNYTAVYSAFATMILFMIWLFLSWLILLTGASFSFYHQHPEYLAHGPNSPDISIRQHERYALAAMYLVARRFQRGQEACPAAWLATRLLLPEPLVQGLLAALEEAGFVTRTAAEPPGYLPARDPGRIAVADVLDSVRASGEVPRTRSWRDAALAPVDALMGERDAATSARLDGVTVAELCAREEEGSAAAEPTPTRHIG